MFSIFAGQIEFNFFYEWSFVYLFVYSIVKKIAVDLYKVYSFVLYITIQTKLIEFISKIVD